MLVSEVIHLPAHRRDEYRRVQRDYVAEWVTLLRRAHADLDESAARVRVHAALSLINSLFRIPHLCGRPGHVRHTAALALAVLQN